MDNDKLIADFLTSISAEGLSKPRILKYNTTLHTISRLLDKDFKRCDIEDLKKLFAKMQQGEIKSSKDKEYAEESKRDFKIVIKRFWRWLEPCDDEKEYPKEVRWIRTSQNGRLKKIIKTKDCLTEDEVYKMIDAAIYPRDKAIISLLYESASRIGEILGLKISDIVFDDKGYSFETNIGKTGEIYKRVMNPKAVNCLKQWIAKHPMKDDKDAPLWITLSRSNMGSRPMGRAGFTKMLKDTASKVGITKRVTCHQFRHARITDLRVNKKVPDAIIEMLVGWKPGSDMFDTYQHAKSGDVDNALSQVYTEIDEETAKENTAKTATKLIEFLALMIQKYPEVQKDMGKELPEIMKGFKRKR